MLVWLFIKIAQECLKTMRKQCRLVRNQMTEHKKRMWCWLESEKQVVKCVEVDRF